MADLNKLLLYVAREIAMEVLEGDMIDDGTSTISVADADGDDVDLTLYSEVRLDIFGDKRYQSRVYRFSNLTADGVLVRGNGFYSLSATPFPLRSTKEYRYKFQVLISAGNYKTFSFGDFKVVNI
jgi:hypothetical protein